MSLWTQRYKTEGHVENRPRPGAARKTTADIDALIYDFADRTPFTTAAAIAREFNLSERVVRLRLNAANLYHRIPSLQTTLTDWHREQRIRFCEENQGLDWDRVIFSDEKTFRSCDDRKKHLWRPKGERFNPKYVQSVKMSGRVTCGVWGFITAMGVGHIVGLNGNQNSVQYTEILEDILMPSMNIMNEDWRNDMLYMHDNARYHTCPFSRDWIRNHNIQMLEWPSLSPDLNPIENVWAKMVYGWGSEIVATPKAILEKANQRFDDMIGTNFFQNLYASMPRRLNEVINNNGNWCKY